MASQLITWRINLLDMRRWSIQRTSLWRPPVSVRANLLTLPGTHGTVNLGLPVFDEPQINFDLLLKGKQAELEAAQLELVGLFTQPGLLVSRVAGGKQVSADARLVSITPGEMVADTYAKFQVTVALPGVFLRGAVATSTPAAVTNNMTYRVDILDGSTAPVGDGLIRVKGPITAIQITDKGSGTGLSWSGSNPVPAGTYLFLNARTWRAWTSTNANAWGLGGTNVTAGLDYPKPGILQMWPTTTVTDNTPGVKTAQLTVTGSGTTSATEICVQTQPAWL